ncbi:MAG TPA: hypothetical protein VGI76_02850 [Solirubrobacteraceae bacterium]
MLADGGQGFDGGGALLHVLGGQLDGVLAVVALDGLLDELRSQARPHGALRAARAADAEEVGVAPAALAAAEAVGQAVAADPAVDAAAQVLAANLVALLGNTLLAEQALHAVEGLLVDQCLVAAGEGLFLGRAALVDDPAGVVSVAQDALEAGVVDLLRRAADTRPGAQPEPVQLAHQFGDGVFAGGVELEGQGQVVLALRVGDGYRDAAAIGQLVYIVEVAEARPAVGASVLGLLVDAAADVLAGLHRLVLVLGGDDGLGEESGGAVVADHRLADADQLRARLVHQVAGHPVVLLVACPPAEAPDDHVVHAG